MKRQLDEQELFLLPMRRKLELTTEKEKEGEKEKEKAKAKAADTINWIDGKPPVTTAWRPIFSKKPSRLMTDDTEAPNFSKKPSRLMAADFFVDEENETEKAKEAATEKEKEKEKAKEKAAKDQEKTAASGAGSSQDDSWLALAEAEPAEQDLEGSQVLDL